MNDAELMKVVTNMIRRQERERKIAWVMTPALVLCAYLAGRHHRDHPLVIPTAAKAETKVGPLLVDEPYDRKLAVQRQELKPPGSPVPIRREPEKKEDWPWGIRPDGGMPSERPKSLTGAELESWTKAQREQERMKALYPSPYPPDG